MLHYIVYTDLYADVFKCEYFNQVTVWLSWQVGRWSQEAPIRPGAAVGWDTRWRQIFAMLYPVTKEVMFFLQTDFFSPGQMSLWRVKQLTYVYWPIPLSPPALHWYQGTFYQGCGTMGTAVWAGVPSHQVGTECHLQTNTFLSLPLALPCGAAVPEYPEEII